MIKLAIFTDEISADPQRAIALAAEWKISAVEVRGLPGGRFPRVKDQELESFHAMLVDAGLRISGVSPGLFKCPVDDPTVPGDLDAVLPRACEWAQKWGTDLVSVFAFLRDESAAVPAAVVDRLGQMAAVAESHGCRLLLENEAVCWGDTGVEAAGIVCAVNAPNFSLLWDPGNSARAGSVSPYPDEYAQLKELVSHVHLKNFHAGRGQWSLMHDGVVDWPGQFAALVADGYDGFVVIETHLKQRPDDLAPTDGLDDLENNSLHNLNYLRTHLDR
jgi:sugar phosphate isomerase/epimerase